MHKYKKKIYFTLPEFIFQCFYLEFQMGSYLYPFLWETMKPIFVIFGEKKIKIGKNKAIFLLGIPP